MTATTTTTATNAMTDTTDTTAVSQLDETVRHELRAAVAGSVITPGDDDYDAARAVWNGLIDRHPGAIVRCTGTADVVAVLDVARRHRTEIAIRGGGHQVAGSGVCDGGIVIDLSEMNAVHVDVERRTAHVQAGARWRDVDRATQRFGLATTGGEVSDTGVAGLTLGGGMGLLHRAFGLSCDNVRSVEIVTADGVVRVAGPHEHPDLYWAARGAGRGIGVVTSFEFALHPLGPDVAVSWVLHPIDRAAEVARQWRELALAAPETITPQFLLWSVPPDPEIPTDLHGTPVAMTLALYAGDPAEAEPVLAPFAEIGEPLLDLSGVYPYVDLQSSMDALVPAGDRYLFKAHFVDDLDDQVIDRMAERYRGRPNDRSLIALRTMGGAIDRVSAAESAYPHRGRRFNLSIDGAWSDPADDDRAIEWVRSMWSSLRPFADGGVYVNFAGLDDEPDVTTTDTFGDVARLTEIRAAYDPTGLFDAASARR